MGQHPSAGGDAETYNSVGCTPSKQGDGEWLGQNQSSTYFWDTLKEQLTYRPR
jgi:hypothetical protein